MSCRLKLLPHTSHENSGLLWVRSWIIRLYDLANRRWQNLHTNGAGSTCRILRRKSDRWSSLSIRINVVNILTVVPGVGFRQLFFFSCDMLFSIFSEAKRLMSPFITHLFVGVKMNVLLCLCSLRICSWLD